MRPTEREVRRVRRSEAEEKVGGMGEVAEIRRVARCPKRRPRRPPVRQMMRLSKRKWKKMWLGAAPRLIRIPISWRRSATETSIMFMTPMPPIRRLMEVMMARAREMSSKVGLEGRERRFLVLMEKFWLVFLVERSFWTASAAVSMAGVKF